MDEVVGPSIESLLALGSVEPGKADRLRRRVDRIVRTAGQISPRPTLAVLQRLDPPEANTGRVSDLIRLAGGRPNPAGTDTWEVVRRADPDVLLLAPTGLSVEQTRARLDLLTERPGYEDLTSVAHRKVYILDGDTLEHLTGPRLVDGLEILAQLLHPQVFPGLVHLDETKLLRL